METKRVTDAIHGVFQIKGEKNVRHFADNIFKLISLYEDCCSSDNKLVLKKRLAIIRNDDGLFYRHMCASLGLDQLNSLSHIWVFIHFAVRNKEFDRRLDSSSIRFQPNFRAIILLKTNISRPRDFAWSHDKTNCDVKQQLKIPVS